MTYFFSVTVLLLSLGTGALAQPAAPIRAVGAPLRQDTINAERARIVADRNRNEAGFLVEDAVCYKRFAVNNCLDEVNVRRRASIADLRRQEILLNDEERKTRGAEQLRKTEEKASAENQQEAANRRGQAVEDYQARLESEKAKQADRKKAQDGEKSSRQAHLDRLKAHQEKDQARAAKQAEESEQAKKYQLRQQQAQEARARNEAEKAARTKPPANPLPIPTP